MLRLAIAGCGLISQKKHIPAFLKLRNVLEIVAVCDLNESAAKFVSEKFKIKKYYTSYQDMLLKEKPDIVDICTPPQTHSNLAIQALQQGSHVILEKPMASSVSQCDGMIQASVKSDKYIYVVHTQLFNPAFIKARKLLLNGSVGKFLGLQIF